MEKKKENLSQILEMNTELNVSQSGIRVLEILEKCYVKLKRHLEVAYLERYANENESFDNICRILENNIRTIEYLIWTVRQSNIAPYINGGYGHDFSTNLPRIDFGELYKVILPKDKDN